MYRPNYSVSNADSPSSVREYYPGVPKFLEVTQHSYVEEELIKLFRHQMAFSHASGDGCAKIYNLSLRTFQEGSTKITSEIVWNAFFIHALLLHHTRSRLCMKLPHHGEQSDRIASALLACNEAMVGVGQVEWAHACDDCEKIVEVDAPEGVGRTWARLTADCSRPGTGIATLTRHSIRTPVHREVEEERRRKGRAMFELKRRLQARDVASTIRAVPSVDESSSLLDDPDLDDPAFLDDPGLTSNVERKKPTVPPAKVKSTLTRRWTHNEQLLVRPCGIVISRATFYEAESLPNCRLFLNASFPKHFPDARPSFLFFDNNCKLLAHLVNVEDKHLLHMGFPVDVFHAVRKHGQSDGYCQDHCNPAGFPELIGEQPGEWVFNSSACKQVNVWFAKFFPIVREMSEVHFNFFLDEMIAIHNQVQISELTSKHRHPRLVPVEEFVWTQSV
ncbi:hypothetical protein GSI_05792 [Ganoderma sinense ZZ0214-1]|uniref:CxC5 like cysteine cluster associated with KDZ domain-containing protein n=1 Tax=Ganoderma sinense ZZ0214-1 TaxID=1077348 RepID=A0A2G8SBF1_9APHY|nr:hypothetical protein GSI_05792 [Ganoderma sinense ZZ0214-1]